VDGELLRACYVGYEPIKNHDKRRAFIYLVFTESVGDTSFVKVGMSNHPEKRVMSYATACPLRIRKFFLAEYIGRNKAFGAEQSILRKLGGLRYKGEWARIQGDNDLDMVMLAATGVAPHLVEYPVIHQ